MLRMMLAEPGVRPEDFSTLRKIVYGGSPISEALLEESLAMFGSEFAQIYGLTETGNTAVCLPPADHVPGHRRMKAAGHPYPGVAGRVIDGDGKELPPGAVGEICLATPAHMVEYWGLPGKTAETLVDGWIHTGDAGYVDDDGYVFIQDRIKDAILVAGENVYPAEIENALERHPEVAEAVIVGAPDERWGEKVHAFVVPVAGQEPSPGNCTGSSWTVWPPSSCPPPTSSSSTSRATPAARSCAGSCVTASGATPTARSTDRHPPPRAATKREHHA